MILVFPAALLALAKPSSSKAEDVFQKNSRLGRGVNLLGRGAICENPARSRFQTTHFRSIREAGCNHGLIVVSRKRLMDHFVAAGKHLISLRELMAMCLDAPVEGLNFMMSPLLRVNGVGKKRFWSVVNGLTGMSLGT